MDPDVYSPQPIIPTAVQPGPLLLPGHPLTVAYIPTPEGMRAAYVPVPAAQPAENLVVGNLPTTTAGPPLRTLVSPLMVNVLLGSCSFALISWGLHLLLADLAQLLHLAIVLLAIVCGAPVAWQVLRLALALLGRSSHAPAASAPQTAITARKVIIRKLVNKGGPR